MKKIFIFILLATSAFIMLGREAFAMSETTHVYIHYYRYEGDYDNWTVWIWQNQPVATDGSAHTFVEDDTDGTYNFGGSVAKVELTDNLSDATRIGFIVRFGEWVAKDVEIDRFADIPETSPDGIHHIYLVEGDARIGAFLGDPEGPDKDPKFTFAYFEEEKVIRFRSTQPLTSANIRVLVDDTPVGINSVTINGLIGTVELDESVDFSKEYIIEGIFTEEFTSQFKVTYDGIYDSEVFEDAFGYDGILGVEVHQTLTRFKLWAPVSSAVQLNLYNTGTPSNLGGTDTPIATHEMTLGEKGVYQIDVQGNLHGTYYTFSVTNGSNTHEVVDPYAYAVGINGVRGMVIDFQQVNPSNWVYNNRPDNMEHPTDAIIYELQVRDLTTHSSWNGSDENRGKFLGLIESGTQYNGVSTGFDHIKELGVTHVQLLPFFDFGYVDESRVGEPGYNAFNWGYMPINFNALEGSFSSNPYDGDVRINEMKQVVMGYHNADIRLIMDVVYNHTGLTADSNFNLIVPGYYFRLNEDGSFSNGSGTGNETASERYMMRKFIIDSLVFWATEYNMSGFRFDLMALHDVETMNQIVDALHDIDPSIMIFGEPWMGGSTPLPRDDQAGKTNLVNMPGVGAFNDDFRDAVKGSVFAHDQGGFVQGDFTRSIVNRVVYGIVGGVAHDGIPGFNYQNYTTWHNEPYKTINYVTAHDNNTLHDKLHLTLNPLDDLDKLVPMFMQASALVLTSQGVSFIHAGDEFLRSKPDDGYTKVQYTRNGFVHNSYESTDTVNQLRWDLKSEEQNMMVFEYFKGLIEIRKAQSSMRMNSAIDIQNHLRFLYEDVEGLIAYELTNENNTDQWGRILVIHNANDRRKTLRLPKDGGWRIVANGTQAGVETIDTALGGARLRVPAHTTFIMYQDSTIADTNPVPLILGVSAGVLGIAGLSTLYVLKIKKKTPLI